MARHGADERDIYRGVVVDQFGDASLLEYLRERSRADSAGGHDE